MKVYLMPQYTPEWWEARRGRPTASEFDKILTPTGKRSAQAKRYAARLATELVNLSPTAFSDRRIGTPAMEAGRRSEPDARRFYSLLRGTDVQQVGFVVSACGRFGCSPDGLVGLEAADAGQDEQNGLLLPWVEAEAAGLLELKCPLLETHAEYRVEGDDYLPGEYKPQVHGQLLVTGLPWVDFLSYAEGLDAHLVRVVPDDYTRLLAEALDEFLALYADTARKLLGEDHPAVRKETTQC